MNEFAAAKKLLSSDCGEEKKCPQCGAETPCPMPYPKVDECPHAKSSSELMWAWFDDKADFHLEEGESKKQKYTKTRIPIGKRKK